MLVNGDLFFQGGHAGAGDFNDILPTDFIEKGVDLPGCPGQLENKDVLDPSGQAPQNYSGREKS